MPTATNGALSPAIESSQLSSRIVRTLATSVTSIGRSIDAMTTTKSTFLNG